MVKFFDQKQEVIQIELTPYGREQYANGKFSPQYYTFHDTGILYDGICGSKTETQNEIVTRIKNTTPRLRPQTRFTSSLGQVVTLKSLNSKNQFKETFPYVATYNRVLGDSSVWSDYMPSWDITVDKGSTTQIDEGVEYLAGRTIPRVTVSCSIEYDYTTTESSTLYTLVKSDKIILDMQELNTQFKLNGNFDIEIFKVEPDQSLRSLGFINPETQNSQALSNQTYPSQMAETIAGTNADILAGFPKLDNTYVEYYLDVMLDQEIDGVSMPSNSTIYKSNFDKNPGSICLTDEGRPTYNTDPGGN